MAQGQRRTDEEWTRLSKEMRGSGQPQKAWCREHDINIRSLHNWKNRQRHKECVVASVAVGFPTQPEWLEVEPKNRTDPVQPSRKKTLEVRIGACIVNVPSDFDKGSFLEVVRVLLSLC
jgi:hypothetical protein